MNYMLMIYASEAARQILTPEQDTEMVAAYLA